MEQKHKWEKEIIAFFKGEKVECCVNPEFCGKTWFNVEDDLPFYYVFRTFNDPIFEFRIASKTILINGHEVPKPLREEPEYGTTYFYPYFCDIIRSLSSNWKGDLVDENRLKVGFVHLTEEAAIKHAEALLSFTKEDKK